MHGSLCLSYNMAGVTSIVEAASYSDLSKRVELFLRAMYDATEDAHVQFLAIQHLFDVNRQVIDGEWYLAFAIAFSPFSSCFWLYLVLMVASRYISFSLLYFIKIFMHTITDVKK